MNKKVVEILDYCENKGIQQIFLDFFGTIVKRNCAPEEIKIRWAKEMAQKLCYCIDETQLLLLRKKSEQAVIAREESGEFEFKELCSEVYRRIAELDRSFQERYPEDIFFRVAHDVEIETERKSQSYFPDTIELIHKAHAKGLHISIISDFYLSQEDLRFFLRKDDISQKIEYIFVSSDSKTSKHVGGLYAYVCKQLKLEGTQCVMIGNNPKSDVINAEKYGMKGFLLEQTDGSSTKEQLTLAVENIGKQNINGVLGYSNYCFLLYLYSERLYKSLIRDGIKDVYFLSREGEFLKKMFDYYLRSRLDESIRTHYLYVSRKATYPATLKPLSEERFEILRKFPEFSLSDFFENIGMSKVTSQLQLDESDAQKPVEDFFNSSVFIDLCVREDFHRLYESSRIRYNTLFRRYCAQEGITPGNRIAIADVGWNGTMQDNIVAAIPGLECVGFYIGLINKAYSSENNKKTGLIFHETPCDSDDLSVWKYDNVFMERILWASHGATDHYEEQENSQVMPVLKEYISESENYQRIKPVQMCIEQKFEELDGLFLKTGYSAEFMYHLFLQNHMKMLFWVNRSQLELQRKMIRGQMQNFGHISIAGDSIGRTFSHSNIIRKVWNRMNLVKNTELVFRILLNYNRKFFIILIYRLHYFNLIRKEKLCGRKTKPFDL